MKTLRRYILGELVWPFSLILSILCLLLVFTQIIRVADLAVRKGVDLSIVGKIILFSFPTLLPFALPMALVTTLLLVLGRMSADNEFLVIRASGINIYVAVAPILVIGIILSLFSIVLNDQIQPRAHFDVRRLIVQLGYQNPFALIEPGEFIDDFENYILFVQNIEDKTLKNVLIYELQDGKEVRTIHAREGQMKSHADGSGFVLNLIDGFAEEPDHKDPSKIYTVHFESCPLEFAIHKGSTSGGKIYKRLKELTIAEIQQAITGFDDKKTILRYKTEMHRKIASAFAGFSLMIVCIPLAIRTRHGEKSIGFALSIVVLVAYYTMYFFSQSFSEAGFLNPWIMMWIPNMVTMGMGVLLFQRMLLR